MSGKWTCLNVLALALGMLFSDPAYAGGCVSIFGWHVGRDCPRSDYSPLHYWVPEAYKLRAYVHPTSVDQYTAGPATPVEPAYETTRYRCRTLPPAPSTPYADPAAYYGRQIVVE